VVGSSAASAARPDKVSAGAPAAKAPSVRREIVEVVSFMVFSPKN
jgi:hypothetical protein